MKPLKLENRELLGLEEEEAIAVPVEAGGCHVFLNWWLDSNDLQNSQELDLASNLMLQHLPSADHIYSFAFNLSLVLSSAWIHHNSKQSVIASIRQGSRPSIS